MKRLAAALTLVLAATLLASCTTSTVPVLSGLSGGRSLALACVDAKGLLHDDLTCTADTAVRALVGGGSRGTLSLANPSVPSWVDLSWLVPGFTPLRVPGPPVALAIDVTGAQAFAVISAGPQAQIARVGLQNLGKSIISSIGSTPIDFEPSDAVLVARAGGWWLVVADPNGQQLHVADSATFGQTVQWTTWPVPGSPATLAWLSSQKQLWVGHLQHGYVSVLDVETGKLVGAPISIDVACRDGLDNDGDGLVDRADSGCDGPDDVSETAAEVGATLCGNGLDDDGDGQTDAADLGCQKAPVDQGVVDGCRNGVDDDGDGKTDFPDDPGCSGYADASENSDAAPCANGHDDDGDGLTDLADPDCQGQPGGAEWPVTLIAQPAAVASAMPCANGIDDDGDGLVDMDDSGCFNRGSGSEAGPDMAPAARIAASFDGRWVAVAHQGRRELMIIDAQTRTLLLPKRGETAPYLRTSRLDEREGVMGLAMGAPVTAIAPITYAGQPAFAAVTTPGGLFVVRPTGDDGITPSVRLVVAASQTATVVAKPALMIAGTAVDMGASVPTRYAALGPLRLTATTAGTNYYGIQPNTESYEHRTEQWRLTYQGLLPGGQRSTGQWRGAGLLHDPTADFCQLGVVPGDLVVFAASTAPGCPSKPVVVPVLQVYGDTLQLDTTAAREDLVLTTADQLGYDLSTTTALHKPAQLPGPQCAAVAQVAYSVRAADWLLVGSRTGLLSSRKAHDGLCADLPSDELLGARLTEPKLRQQADGTPQRPTSCPYAAGALDPAFEPTPLQTPIFAGLQLQPGCQNHSDAAGKPVVGVLPSLREATWIFNVTAGFRPRVTAVGSAPTAVMSGPGLARAYVVDGGAATLDMVEISTGNLLATLQ